MEKIRVAVTGMGVISPIGNSMDIFWENIKAGTVGIGENTRFDTSDIKWKLDAEVKDFRAADYMDAKSARRMELFSQYAVAAAKQAIENSGLDLGTEDVTRIGVSVGSGIGSLQVVEKNCQILDSRGAGRVNPLLVPLMISNMAAGNVAIAFGLKGKCTNVVTACATGTHSIGDAMRAIQCGEADVMIAGGCEAAITPIGIAGFGALTALNESTDPLRFRSIKSGAALLWERAPACWCWNPLSMQRRAAPGSLRSLPDMAQPVTPIISRRLRRMGKVLPEQCCLQ